VIVAIHSYLGLHVIAREVIFVDLSLAQMAALGSAVAILAGSQPDSSSALIYALGFTSLGAATFALTRTSERGAVPQEAIIGIVYVMASAAAILVADRTPRGGEAIKDILVGSLLWVTWPTILRLAGIYAVVGLIHWALRRRFLTISFSPETALARGWKIRWWDFLFYLTFGIVITFSVPIAGVLLVFSFLVVPAAVAFHAHRDAGGPHVLHGDARHAVRQRRPAFTERHGPPRDARGQSSRPHAATDLERRDAGLRSAAQLEHHAVDPADIAPCLVEHGIVEQLVNQAQLHA
jgi:zinc/manganese transport system permease protein